MYSPSILSEHPEEQTRCCMIGFYPTQQKPHNIIRTISLLDLFVASFVMTSATLEIKDFSLLLPRSIMVFSSSLMFGHALYMVMYYKEHISDGRLIEHATYYGCFRW